ncbi:MAG: 2-succinyl-5-enolpyruvyl-6-hydroxy-3-cyclohexene-1-carboxylic-acid synthase [Myxococcota bacterium]
MARSHRAVADRIGPEGGVPGDAMAADPVYAFTGAFFQALVASGVRHCVVSPGSRSTPLTLAAAACPGLELWPVVDERSAAFFALGLARASRDPVALVCTSGSAAANYWPAVVEAHHSRVPLILLTADRPPELRGWGAGQTIDQLALYGRSARWLGDLPVAGESGARPEVARAWAARAAAESRRRPGGPVQLNWPFREPLEPREGADRSPGASRGAGEATRVSDAVALPDPDQTAELAELMGAHPRGLVVAGPIDATPDQCEALCELARSAGHPIWADPLSGLRRGLHAKQAPLLSAGDFWARHPEQADAVRPDLVIRFGAMPTSKAFRLWLERTPPAHTVLVDPDSDWADPSASATWVLDCDPAALCRGVVRRAHGSPGRDVPVAGRDPRGYLDAALALDAEVARRVGQSLDAAPFCEPVAVRALLRGLPEGALLWVANSMPVRDVDAWLAPGTAPLRVVASRGANGIDGTASSALGAAAAHGGPAVLLCGDLAFLHDLGGLLSARQFDLPLVIVVLDNGGGGIFSMLPVAKRIEARDFDRWFRTPHGLDLARAGDLFGLATARVSDETSLLAAVNQALASGRPGLVVARLDPDVGWSTRRAAWAAAGTPS